MLQKSGDINRIATLLKGIRDAVVIAGNHTTEAIRENEATRQHGNEPEPSAEPKRVIVEVDLSTREADRYYSEQRHSEKLQSWTFGATFCTLLAVVAYTVIAYYQWSAMDNTLKESIRNFRTDERGRIELDSIKTTVISPSHRFPVSFKYYVFLKNVGKTVARDAVLRRLAGAVGPQVNQSSVELAQHQLLMGKQAVPPYPMPQAFAPNAVLPIPFTLSGSPPPYHGSYYHSLGRIDYVDEWGTPHWLTFCFETVNAKGDLQYCEYGNNEDDNPASPKN